MLRRPNYVTEVKAVERAIKRCDDMGREAFRAHYGFGVAKSYFLHLNGKTYDSKPIVAVAFGYQHSTTPLAFDEFSGGAATVKPVLEKLGFLISSVDLDDDPPTYTSEWLELQEVYTRDELREMFSITDATSNNGVFKPRGSRSIWLFVTRDKTADRPQLIDSLDGDVLFWEGQPAGRTDKMLVDHLENGDEVLLFYRERRSQFAKGGFRYEGPFLYRSHKGSKPTAFVFDRDSTSNESASPAASGEFDPKNVADGRSQVLALVRRRQGQPKFRADLIKAYSGRCAISGCEFLPLLEAAHIYPYRGTHTNDVANGLLLRADIHTLFDLGLIAVRPDCTLDVCASLAKTEYATLEKIHLPKLPANHPSAAALAWHRERIASSDARAKLITKLEKERDSSAPASGSLRKVSDSERG